MYPFQKVKKTIQQALLREHNPYLSLSYFSILYPGILIIQSYLFGGLKQRQLPLRKTILLPDFYVDMALDTEFK